MIRRQRFPSENEETLYLFPTKMRKRSMFVTWSLRFVISIIKEAPETFFSLEKKMLKVLIVG